MDSKWWTGFHHDCVAVRGRHSSRSTKTEEEQPSSPLLLTFSLRDMTKMADVLVPGLLRVVEHLQSSSFVMFSKEPAETQKQLRLSGSAQPPRGSGSGLTAGWSGPADPSLGSLSLDRCLGNQFHTTASRFEQREACQDAAPSTATTHTHTHTLTLTC